MPRAYLINSGPYRSSWAVCPLLPSFQTKGGMGAVGCCMGRAELFWVQDYLCSGPLVVREPSQPSPHLHLGGMRAHSSSILQRSEQRHTGFADLTLESHR